MGGLTPLCPMCGSPAVETLTKYGKRHDCCGLWSWDGAALVSAETHEARKRAHEAFDRLWQQRLLPRKAAYQILADKLGLMPKDCHIKLMSAEIASKIPEIVKNIRRELGA